MRGHRDPPQPYSPRCGSTFDHILRQMQGVGRHRTGQPGIARHRKHQTAPSAQQGHLLGQNQTLCRRQFVMPEQYAIAALQP